MSADDLFRALRRNEDAEAEARAKAELEQALSERGQQISDLARESIFRLPVENIEPRLRAHHAARLGGYLARLAMHGVVSESDVARIIEERDLPLNQVPE